MKTIKVKGSFEKNFSVDYINIYFNINKKFSTYNECVDDSIKVNENIYQMINNLGFKKDDLALTNFDVLPYNESYYEDDIYKSRQVGYSYTENYKLGMDLDFKKLGDILQALEDNKDNIAFNLSFTLKNDEVAKNTVLKLAIKECNKKAKVIAKAVNMELKDIVNIDYESYNNHYERPLNCAAKASVTPSFKPNDVVVKENIEIIYEII